MSEGTISIKKAVPIIVLTWILSMVTTLALVYFVPFILPRSWHGVAMFSGTSIKAGNRFYVSSDHWRIYWFAKPDPLNENTSFRFFVFNSEEAFAPYFESDTLTASDFEKQYFSGILLSFNQPPAGFEYITGKGGFFIDVLADSAKWIITVEAYY